MIGNIQLLRALAALSVVFYHANYTILDGKHVYFMGVPLFFVISGFIITYITRSTSRDFLLKRLIRIVPIYWFITIFTVIWFGYGLANPSYAWPLIANWIVADPVALASWIKSHTASMLSHDQMWKLVRSLLFLPLDQFPTLAVGWTLNVEIYFYVIFAISLSFSRHYAPIIASIAILLVMIGSRSAQCGVVCYYYGHEYMPFFVSGVLVYYGWRAVEERVQKFRRTVLTLSAVAFSAWPIGSIWFDDNPVVLYTVPPAVLFAALALHSLGFRMQDRLTLAMGASSYALYLIHTTVLETLRAAGVIWLLPSSTPGLLIGTTTSVAIAYLVYAAIELPLLRFLTARARGRPASNIGSLRRDQEGASGLAGRS